METAPARFTEAQYRAHYLGADIAQCRFALLVLIAPTGPFLYFDYALFGAGEMFWWLAASRVVVAAYTLWVWRQLVRVDDASVLDRRMAVWCVVGIAAMLSNNSTRPPEYFGHYIVDIWVILMIFAAVPLPVRLLTPLAVVYTGLSFAVLFLVKRPPIPLYTWIVVLMLSLSVVCGTLVSARIHRYRKSALDARLELERQARTDPLTGAINRREFLRIANEELERHARLGKPLALLMLDLDHFKQVNDRHGHAAGDEVLIEFARRAGGALRGYDQLARIGGEEFCALLPEAAPEEAQAIAERIRTALAAAPVDATGTAITVTVSVGIATARVGELRIEDLMRRADEALYAAKNAGRDRAVLALA